MEIDAIAAAATTMKASQVQISASIAAQKKTMDIAKSNGELVLQLILKSMGVGQNVDVQA